MYIEARKFHLEAYQPDIMRNLYPIEDLEIFRSRLTSRALASYCLADHRDYVIMRTKTEERLDES